MKIQRNIPLASLTTFRVGGEALFFTEVNSLDDLKEAVAFGLKEKIPLFVLGGGSNILVNDQGFAGLVVKIYIKGISYEQKGNDVFVTSKAGELWDDLVSFCVSKGFWGIENLSFIPGTVGAAPVQNIGAYGVELKDILEKVFVFDKKDSSFKYLSLLECDFAYRDSIFKKENRYIVVEVILKLSLVPQPKLTYKDIQVFFEKHKEENPNIMRIREVVVEIRKNKLPDWHSLGTAGSFFKNPIINRDHHLRLLEKYPTLPAFEVDALHVKIPLAWILDKVCGLKGFREGYVGLYEHQPLALVNFGGATSTDIENFAEKISKIVKEKTNIEIEWEVQKIK
ncbi:MAG: hypothetical protein RJA61_569 [Candidatus Parcubacteria bacterium]|jgi:UDP-N-acetylmuramate dehydrogenase